MTMNREKHLTPMMPHLRDDEEVAELLRSIRQLRDNEQLTATLIPSRRLGRVPKKAK